MLIDAAARAAMRTQIENRIASHPAKNIETARSMILKHAEALKKDEHFSNNLEALKIRVLSSECREKNTVSLTVSLSPLTTIFPLARFTKSCTQIYSLLTR